MTRLFLATAAVVLAGGAAYADPFASMYGNTLSITSADGSKSAVYINQDMSWEQHLAGGQVLKGTYAWKDAQTACFTVTDPPPKDPGTATNCYGPQSDHKVGDSWTLNDAAGKPSALALTAGR